METGRIARRLLTAGFVLCLCASGAAMASIPPSTLFEFVDDAADDSNAHLLELTGFGATIQLFDTTNTLALEIAPGSLGGVVDTVSGQVEYDFDAYTVNWNALGGSGTDTGTGSHELQPNGAFSVGIKEGSISTITAASSTKYIFEYSLSAGGTGSFTLDDISISAVPIPAAGIMLISALTGLLVVGRRSKSKERAKQTGSLAAV